MIVPEPFRSMNATKMGIWSFVAIILGVSFGCFLSPWGLKKMIKGQMNLTPKSPVRPMYTKVPFAIDFRVYMFNLTNREEASKGGKPRLQEIGPYYFEEWKEKFDLVDNDEDDTLTYHYKNTFIFRPDLSGPGLTGDEIITMPHPVMAGMILAVNVDKKPMVSLVGKAIDSLFHEPKDMFWTGRVMDMLFDGVPIDCTSNDFSAQAVCSVFDSGDINAIRKVDDGKYMFSLFAGVNGTDLGEFRVFRGKKNSRDIGKVVSFNGDEEMSFWDDEECDKYVGTDSTIFAPYMKLEDGIWAYEPSICRSLGATYKEPSKYMGVPTYMYELDIGAPENTPQCFCRDPPDECPPKGTFDLFKCVGSPMFGSLPHFYLCDPSLIANIESGLYPEKEKHGIAMHFELMTGTPMSAAKRLQFNLEVVPIEGVPFMENARPMMYPLFWVEEGASLNKTFVNMIKNKLFLAIKISNTIKWLCVVFGIIGIILAGLIMQGKQSESVQVTKSVKEVAAKA